MLACGQVIMEWKMEQKKKNEKGRHFYLVTMFNVEVYSEVNWLTGLEGKVFANDSWVQS